MKIKRLKIIFKGQNIGRAAVLFYDDGEVFFSDFVLRKEFRNKGLGQKAFKVIMQKYNITSLSVGVHNDKAIHIYEKYGFKKVGGPYYDNSAKEFLVYMKLLKKNL